VWEAFLTQTFRRFIGSLWLMMLSKAVVMYIHLLWAILSRHPEKIQLFREQAAVCCRVRFCSVQMQIGNLLAASAVTTNGTQAHQAGNWNQNSTSQYL